MQKFDSALWRCGLCLDVQDMNRSSHWTCWDMWTGVRRNQAMPETSKATSVFALRILWFCGKTKKKKKLVYCIDK